MAKKILLLTDSSITMSPEDAVKYDVKILPLAIYRNDGKEFINELQEVAPESLLKMYDEGYKFTTSCTPQLMMEENIKEWLETYDYIIALPISSKWSSQYSHLKALSNGPLFKNKLYVADILEYGFATENLCIDLRKMIDEEGIDNPLKLLDYANNYHRKTICFFACKTLDGLVASGRVPKVVAKLFKLTKIYPLIRVEAENHLEKIVKNWNEIPSKMIKATVKTFGTLTAKDIKAICVLTAGNSQEYINEFKEALAKELKLPVEKIQVRWAPNIFINIVLKNSIGVHVITNKNKVK